MLSEKGTVFCWETRPTGMGTVLFQGFRVGEAVWSFPKELEREGVAGWERSLPYPLGGGARLSVPMKLREPEEAFRRNSARDWARVEATKSKLTSGVTRTANGCSMPTTPKAA